jgi:integrase/recombinase XerD|tara:strand:+ start:1089 stop:1619 length:531 start_codon:yes stop_codon:yes gene_type:complete
MVRYSKDDILLKEDIEQLIKACSKPKEKFIVITLIYTGMRIGEFCAMRKEWIRWQENKIVVPQQEGDWQPKTKEGARDIPMVNNEVREELRSWFKDHEETGIGRVGAYKLLQRVAKKGNFMKKVYPHSLRATFASMMASKGVTASSIQAIMGWKSFATAQNYVKSMEAGKEVIEKW